MQLKMRSFAIMQSNGVDFESEYYSGYLGLGPYSSDSQIQDESMIYHLYVKEKLIDSPSFSIYLQKDSRSSIKFGGYDREALHDENDFTAVKTVDKKSWKVKAQNFNINDKPFGTQFDSSPEFLVEP